MILILSPIPQILFYKKREQQDKIAPVALVFNTKYVIGSGSDKNHTALSRLEKKIIRQLKIDLDKAV